jgi:thymidylate synthase (FAD)
MLVASAAKLCYSPSSIEETRQKCDAESSAKFVKMLAEMGHQSPLEHINFTFAIEGVSRIFLAQFTRHRIASYSVQSQRYVKETGFNFVMPPQIEKNPEAKREFENLMNMAKVSYEKIEKFLYNSGENYLNISKEKKSIEDARYVLPGAIETKIICSFNARSLLNFFKVRCCERAQWEIKEVALEMLRLVLKISPNIFASAGPPCFNTNVCHEGKLSCGKREEVIKKFKNLSV